MGDSMAHVVANQIRKGRFAVLSAIMLAFACFLCVPSLAFANSGTLSYKDGGQTVTKSYGDISSLLSAAKSSGKDVTISLSDDWNTKSYGRIVIPEGRNYTFELNGHMINRDKAFSFGDKWYGEGKCDVIHVEEGAMLTVNGGTGEAAETVHYGTLDTSVGDGGDYFWKYDGSGPTGIYGGLITGGAGDDHYGGGGISTEDENAKVYLNDVTIAGNLADQWLGSYGHGAGVALHGENSTLEMSNAQIIYNHAEGLGGGVYVRNEGCTIKLTNGSKISNNYSAQDGGGVYFDDDNDSIELDKKSQVGGNYATGSGGGIYGNGESNKVKAKDGSSISNNKAVQDGGGIFTNCDNASIDLSATTMSKNAAGSGYSGGALCLKGVTTANLTSGTKLSENTATTGAGIYTSGKLELSLSASQISSNTATSTGGSKVSNGGGLYLYAPVSIDMEKSAEISSNSAGTLGGGIWSRGILDIRSDDKTGVISSNTCRNAGGGIFLDTCAENVSLEGIKITKNEAANGAGVYALGVNGGGNGWGTLRLADVNIVNNAASKESGGVYCWQVNPVICGTVVVDKNTSNGATGNFYLYNSTMLLGTEADNPPTKDCKIGISIRNYDGSDRQLTKSKDFISLIGESDWVDCLYTDDDTHSIELREGILYMVDKARGYTVTVKRADGDTKEWQESYRNKVVLGSGSYIETSYISSGRAYVEWRLDSWLLQYADGMSQVLAVSDGEASFVMPDMDVTLTPVYTPSLCGVALNLNDARTWDDFAGDANAATVEGATLLSADATKSSAGNTDGISVGSCSVTTNDDGTKTAVYTVMVASSIAEKYGMYLSKAGGYNVGSYVSTILPTLCSAEISTKFGIATGKVKVTAGDNATATLQVTATFAEPTTSLVNVARTSANTGKSLGTTGVAFEGSSTTVSAPAIAGWEFAGWDESSLPEGATVSGDNLTISTTSENVSVTATYAPCVDTIDLSIDGLVNGVSFPTAAKAIAATDAEGESLNASVASLIWTDSKGNAVGDTPEAGSTYTGTITLALGPSADDKLLSLAQIGGATVNGMRASTVKSDPDNGTVSISFSMVAQSDSAYDSLVTELSDVSLVSLDGFRNYLPSEVVYRTADGSRISAAVEWDTKLIDELTVTWPLTVKGTFTDINGDSHEITRTFTLLESLEAPTASEDAGEYDDAIEVELVPSAEWAQAGSVSMCYYLLDTKSGKVASSVSLDDYTEYDPSEPIEISTDTELLTYAQVDDRTTEIGSYSYSFSDSYSVKVTSGKAYDSDNHELSDGKAAVGETVSLKADAANTGMQFAGWKVVSGDVSLADASQPETSFAMPAGDVELEATYKYCPITVSFDSAGGSNVEDLKIEDGGSLGTLPVPVYDGYIFDGWYNGSTRATARTTFFTDVTLTAHWRTATSSRYLVTFMDGSSVYDVRSVADGKTVTQPADPAQDGYVFKGWYTDDACTVAFDFKTAVSSDLTLYAKWEQSEPTPEPQPDNPDGTDDGGDSGDDGGSDAGDGGDTGGSDASDGSGDGSGDDGSADGASDGVDQGDSSKGDGDANGNAGSSDDVPETGDAPFGVVIPLVIASIAALMAGLAFARRRANT